MRDKEGIPVALASYGARLQVPVYFPGVVLTARDVLLIPKGSRDSTT